MIISKVRDCLLCLITGAVKDIMHGGNSGSLPFTYFLDYRFAKEVALSLPKQNHNVLTCPHTRTYWSLIIDSLHHTNIGMRKGGGSTHLRSWYTPTSVY